MRPDPEQCSEEHCLLEHDECAEILDTIQNPQIENTTYIDTNYITEVKIINLEERCRAGYSIVPVDRLSGF